MNRVKHIFLLMTLILTGCFEHDEIPPQIEPQYHNYEGQIWQLKHVKKNGVDFSVIFNGKPLKVMGENYYFTCFGRGFAPIVKNAVFELGEPELPFILSWRFFGAISHLEYEDGEKEADFEYDSAGYLIRRTFKNEVISFTHDGEGKILSKKYENGKQEYKFEYNEKGYVRRIINTVNNETISEFIYDNNGYLVKYGKEPLMSEIRYYNSYNFAFIGETMWTTSANRPNSSTYKGIEKSYLYQEILNMEPLKIKEINVNYEVSSESYYSVFSYSRLK